MPDGISFSSSGSFDNFERWLRKSSSPNVRSALEAIGKEGVIALQSATPVDSGIAASSWSYEVRKTRGGWEVVWNNSDIENGFPVAIMLQYGHGTGTGGYVRGQDYINPAMKPIFDKFVDRIGKAVTSA